MSSPASANQLRQRQTRSPTKRRFSDLTPNNDPTFTPQPTVVKYRAVAINKKFDWELELMTIKHHYALKKELTSDITLSPLKIHMQVSFNFDKEDEEGENTSTTSPTTNRNTDTNSNTTNNKEKEECDIRLWLVIDHEDETTNKHANSTFDFGVQYPRRRGLSSLPIARPAPSPTASTSNKHRQPARPRLAGYRLTGTSS